MDLFIAIILSYLIAYYIGVCLENKLFLSGDFMYLYFGAN